METAPAGPNSGVKVGSSKTGLGRTVCFVGRTGSTGLQTADIIRQYWQTWNVQMTTVNERRFRNQTPDYCIPRRLLHPARVAGGHGAGATAEARGADANAGSRRGSTTRRRVKKVHGRAQTGKDTGSVLSVCQHQ